MHAWAKWMPGTIVDTNNHYVKRKLMINYYGKNKIHFSYTTNNWETLIIHLPEKSTPLEQVILKLRRPV